MAPGTNADAAQQRPEHNQKWRCYFLLCVSSLTNFVSVRETRNAELSAHYQHMEPHMDIFGIVTFTAALLILLLDLVGFVRNKFDFQSLKDGKVEGGTLFLFLLWWTCGVIAITRAGAIGYASLNIYFSAWSTFFACIWSLDAWGGEKDILTLKQLAGISITLPYWWVVFWGSVVTLGTAADARRLNLSQYVLESSTQAIWGSTVTTIVSAFFVLSHYEFFPCCVKCASWLTYGGVFELVMGIAQNIWLVIAVDQLTGVGALGSTITGNGNDPSAEDYIPGSNLYVSIWGSFISSCMITVKWKEARAIRFAQTSGGSTVAEEDEEGFGENNEDAEVGAGKKQADDNAGIQITNT